MRGFYWLSWILALALLPFQAASTVTLGTRTPSAEEDSAAKRVANTAWQSLPAPAGPPYDVFLPLVARNHPRPMLIGVYPTGWPGSTGTYTGEMDPFDTWTGKKHSLLGTFVDISPSSGYPADVTGQLTTIWNHGYTPFVNLMALVTAEAIANGSQDAALNSWALAYKAFVEGVTGGGAAFIAPLPEMNGDWKSYAGDPANFKLAYQRIKQRFQTNGVPAGSVRWVFAPNGYTPAGHPTIEEYYPGSSSVDVVSLSSYNFGFMNYCQKGITDPNRNRWDPPSFVFGHYLPQLRTMAPDKPILVSQTGTSADYDASCNNAAAKNQWLTDAFVYLAGESQVRGFIYFNTKGWEDIDWPVYGATARTNYTGYQTGAANPAYRYIAPADLKNMPLLP